MKKYKLFGFSLLITLLLMGCSGGGSSGNDPIKTSNKVTKTGVFLDSAVEGVKYKTSSGIAGFTNNRGEYDFKDGDTVEFFVGDVSLGKVQAKLMLTTDNFPFPIQVAQFLQTLDSDGIADNGIQIVAELHNMPLFKKATVKANDISDFAQNFDIQDFDSSAKNSTFINDVAREAGISRREIISEADAFAHKQKAEKLKRIKENNPELYSYIDGTFYTNSKLPINSNIHTMLASRLSYYIYNKGYKLELDAKIDLYNDAIKGIVSTREKIDSFASAYLNIAGLTTEISIYMTDAITGNSEGLSKETKKRVVNAIKSSGKSEAYGFAYAKHETAKEIVGIVKGCIVDIPWVLSIDAVIGAAAATAGKVFDCAIGETVKATGRLASSYIGLVALQERQYYKIAKIYLDSYFDCGYFNNTCMASKFNGNKTLDDQLYYIMQDYQLDSGIDWSVRRGAKIVIDDYIGRITSSTYNITNLLPDDVFFNYNEGNRDTTTLDIVVNPLKLANDDEGVLWTNININNLSSRDIFLTSFIPKFVINGREFMVASDFYGEWTTKLFGKTFAKRRSMDNIRIPISLNNHTLPESGMARLVLNIEYMSRDEVISDSVQRVIDLDLAELWNSTKMEELDARLIYISKNIDTVYMKEKVYLPDVYLGQTKIIDLNDIVWKINPMSYDAENIIIDSDENGFYINAPVLKDDYEKDIIAFSVSLNSSPYSDSSVFALNILRVSNTKPTVTPQTIVIQYNTRKSITLSASDDDNDTLTYEIITNPSHGTLGGTAPNLTYTPTTDYVGSDSFTFKANDGKDDSDIATINITINERTTNLSKGLVAHYEFEGNANDSSRNGNDGTEYGNISYVNGKIGNAGSFDGVSNIKTPIELNGTNENQYLTISFWGLSEDKNHSTFITNYNYGDGSNSIYFSAKNAGITGGSNQDYYYNGFCYKYFYNNLLEKINKEEKNSCDKIYIKNDIYDSGSSPVDFTNWHYYSITYDNGIEKVFIDGKKVIQRDMDSNLIGGKNGVDSYPRDDTDYDRFLNIGMYNHFKNRYSQSELNESTLKGKIDELRIYKRVLSESEIESLYQLGQ